MDMIVKYLCKHLIHSKNVDYIKLYMHLLFACFCQANVIVDVGGTLHWTQCSNLQWTRRVHCQNCQIRIWPHATIYQVSQSQIKLNQWCWIGMHNILIANRLSVINILIYLYCQIVYGQLRMFIFCIFTFILLLQSSNAHLKFISKKNTNDLTLLNVRVSKSQN